MAKLCEKCFVDGSVDEVCSVYCKTFGWITEQHKALLKKGVEFERTCKPPLTEHHWRHLPRMVFSMEFLSDTFAKFAEGDSEVKVLDVGMSPSYAVLRSLCVDDPEGRLNYTYTSTTGADYYHESSLGKSGGKTVKVVMGEGRLPFDDESFDFVLLEEVLEHVDVHPQHVLAEVSRVLKTGGYLFLTTPNVSSWKKIYNSSNGNWGFDSETFVGEYGHRYEYSYYQVRKMLLMTGFSLKKEKSENVYLNDSNGVASKIQYAGMMFLKFITGEWRSAAKMWIRSGSGLFFLAKKEAGISGEQELMGI